VTAYPNLDHLHDEAKDLLRAARRGDHEARDRLRAAGTPLTLATAQLALAREHGFAGWPALEAAVDARGRELAEKAYGFCEASIRGRIGVAGRMLAETPEIAQADFGVAVVLGDAVAVAAALANDPELARRPDSRSKWTPLHAVCSSRWHRVSQDHADGLLAVARLLIEAGASPRARTGGPAGPSDGWSPLRCAIAITNNGPANEPVMRLLLEHGARPDDHDLYLAGFAADHEHRCLRLLLERTSHPVAVIAQAMSAPVSTGDADALRLLLESGADPDRYLNDDGDPVPAVHEAVSHDCSAEIVELLLVHHADPSAAGADGRSPYQLATARGRADLLELLHRHHAARDARDADRFLFACRTADVAGARSLQAADPAITDRLTDAERGAIVQAAERNNTAAVALMLDLGFPRETRGEDHGATALHAAAFCGAAATVQLLLERGSDVEARDTNLASTPLGWAIVGSGERPSTCANPDWEAVVQTLLDANASTDEITLDPDQPKAPSPQVAEMLRSRGIGATSPDRGSAAL
jgi:ankyrin repeat protein